MTNHARPGAAGIIEAAITVVADHGAVGASLRDFAAQAGVTEAAIYRHFLSRDDLLSQVFRHCASVLHSYLEARAAASPGDEVAELAAAFFDFSADHPREYAFIVAVHQQQLRNIEPGDGPLPKDLFVEAIEARQRAAGGARLPASLVAAAIIGAVMGVTLFREIGQTHAGPDDCRRYLRQAAAHLAAAACGE
jgi:AcrR family transcriptional regulator